MHRTAKLWWPSEGAAGTDDPLFGKGTIRVDGRKIHPVYLYEVKKPAESKGDWDNFKVLSTIPGDEAFVLSWKEVPAGQRMIRGVAATVVVEVRGALDPAAVRYSLLRIIRVEGGRGPPSMPLRCPPKS